MKVFIFIILSGFAVVTFGIINPGDVVCRFFSNGSKRCQQNCRDLSPAEVDQIQAARKPCIRGDSEMNLRCVGQPTSTRYITYDQGIAEQRPWRSDVTASQLNDANVDSVMNVRCTDQLVSGRFTVEQSALCFLFPYSYNAADKNKTLYLGSCLFSKDDKRMWLCQGCTRDRTDVACHVSDFSVTGPLTLFGKPLKPGWSVKRVDYDLSFPAYLCRPRYPYE